MLSKECLENLVFFQNNYSLSGIEALDQYVFGTLSFKISALLLGRRRGLTPPPQKKNFIWFGSNEGSKDRALGDMHFTQSN